MTGKTYIDIELDHPSGATCVGTLNRDTGVAVIQSLQVPFTARRQGIGTLLYRRFEDTACKEGATFVAIDVFHHHEVGKQFWRTLGFQLEGTPGMDEYAEWVKTLNHSDKEEHMVVIDDTRIPALEEITSDSYSQWCEKMADLGLAFNPDDALDSLVLDNGERLFSDREIEVINGIMDRVWAILEHDLVYGGMLDAVFCDMLDTSGPSMQ